MFHELHVTDNIRVDPALPTPNATFKQANLDIFKNTAFAERERGGMWVGDLKSGVLFAILIIDLPPTFKGSMLGEVYKLELAHLFF